MKQETHPISAPTVFTCSNCKTEIHTVSTKQADVNLDVCSNCHPAYTGKARQTAAGSRVDAFNSRYNARK